MVSRSKEVDQATSSEVEVVKTKELPLDVVTGIANFDDAFAFFAENQVEISAGEEIADGFTLLRDDQKKELVGEPFLILDWKHFESTNYGVQDCISARLITKGGDKYRVTFGGTGAYRDLCEIERKRAEAGNDYLNMAVLVKNGLNDSEYWVNKIDGKAMSDKEADETPAELKIKAHTYYLSF